jgi:predicted DNA-binding transcriptional regulator AlpA
MARMRKRITQKTVLKMTGLDLASLDTAIADGKFPAPVHQGKQRLWLTFDVLDWLIDVAVSSAYMRKRLGSKQ